MRHIHYWGLTLAVALCGGFLAIEGFAFSLATATWIAFGVAIAATVLALAAFGVALMREGHAFAGLSALSALIGGWTVIAMTVFADPTAVWLAFAGGIGLLVVSLAALALHETTVERVVHQLDAASPVESDTPAPAGREPSRSTRRLDISAPMRSWLYWLSHVGLMLAGAFVVLMTFSMSAPDAAASPRWIAFGVAIAAACMALGSLVARGLPGPSVVTEHGPGGRRAALALTSAAAAVPVAMIVTMAVYSGDTARWIAFALGCAMVGVSLLAAAIHELTSDRVRHELAAPRPAAERAPADAATAR